MKLHVYISQFAASSLIAMATETIGEQLIRKRCLQP